MIPTFQNYYPSEDGMLPEQRKFYRFLESELRGGRYPDVQGNISYLFVYAYKILDVGSADYQAIAEVLLELAEAYHTEDVFNSYCLSWSNDCLLGMENYDLYLERTEPAMPWGTSKHRSNLRLNIQKHIGLPGGPVDLFKMSSARVSRFAKEHVGLFRDSLQTAFEADAEQNGLWLDRNLAVLSGGYESDTLFQGAPINQPPMPINTLAYYAGPNFLEEIERCGREAENLLRDALDLPRIGEGWVSETALYRAVKERFIETAVVQHGRPAWLGRQHFDIWLPRWRVAIEYHGKQHFEPVDYFGGEDAFEQTRERDQRKIRLAKLHGVHLIVATVEDTHGTIIDAVQARRRQTQGQR